MRLSRVDEPEFLILPQKQAGMRMANGGLRSADVQPHTRMFFEIIGPYDADIPVVRLEDEAFAFTIVLVSKLIYLISITR